MLFYLRLCTYCVVVLLLLFEVLFFPANMNANSKLKNSTHIAYLVRQHCKGSHDMDFRILHSLPRQKFRPMANTTIARFVGTKPHASTEQVQFAMHPTLCRLAFLPEDLWYTIEITALYRASSLGNKALADRRSGGGIAYQSATDFDSVESHSVTATYLLFMPASGAASLLYSISTLGITSSMTVSSTSAGRGSTGLRWTQLTS